MCWEAGLADFGFVVVVGFGFVVVVDAGAGLGSTVNVLGIPFAVPEGPEAVNENVYVTLELVLLGPM